MSRRRTVLLVDDDPGTRHMLQYGLSKAMDGVEVVVATSGREAIAVVESRTVDVVVTDLAMPVGDAFSLIAYLNNSHPAIPIVALSGLEPDEADAPFIAMAGLRVVRKPANSRDVAAAAADAVARVATPSVESIPLVGILRLVAAERRTCTISVTSGRRTGRLHVDAGRLVNAEHDDIVGEAAVSDILGWRDTALVFEGLHAGVRAVIDAPMRTLLQAGTGARSGVRAERIEPTVGAGAEAGGVLDAPSAPPAPHEDARSTLEAAMERLSARIEHADRALAAVGEELAAFRDARRRDDATAAIRERRLGELEAFRDDVARFAHEILGRVDDLFSPAHADEPPPGSAAAAVKTSSVSRSRR